MAGSQVVVLESAMLSRGFARLRSKPKALQWNVSFFEFYGYIHNSCHTEHVTPRNGHTTWCTVAVLVVAVVPTNSVNASPI